MLQPKTVNLYCKILDEVALDMIKRLKTLRNKNNVIESEIDKELNLWAIESIGAIAVGARLNCFDPNLPKNSPVRCLIKCMHDTFAVANELDFKPHIWRYFKTSTFHEAMKVYEKHERYAEYFVKLAKEEPYKQPASVGQTQKEKSILEKLLKIDEHIAVITASDILLAGVDTVYAVTFHNHMCLMDSQFPKAKEYIPERWIEKGQLSHRNAHPFAYSPFGFGTRICIGHRIADLEMETLISRIIQHFRLDWYGPPPGRKQRSINYITGPFNFVFNDV